MNQSAFAPAKVNLYLHVGPLGADGYHPIESWMVFADVGDRVTLVPGLEPGFRVTGPYAGGVPQDASNLAVRAQEVGWQAQGGPYGLELEKNLPPASGLGGGSSDAAAVLRLGRSLEGWSQQQVMALARTLGADVPACVVGRSLIARGRGERLSPGFDAPPLHAVLVNPGRAVSTGAVFALYDQGAVEPLGEGLPLRPLPTVDDVVAMLDGARNDLEAPALTIEPLIVEVLAALRGSPSVRLARMSGSGATCFGLCEDREQADLLAGRLSSDHPAWWVRACTLS